MLIKLNPGQPFWMLLDDTGENPILHLTYEKPGPVELDQFALNTDQQEQLAWALYYRIIARLDGLPKEKIENEAPPEVDHLIDNNPVFRAQKILQGNTHNVGAACEKLAENNEYELLEVLLALEQRGENQNGAPRKTVIQMINKALAKTGGVSSVTDSDQVQVELVQEDPEEKEDAES